MSDVDALIVGAGVVGLACALTLARQGQEVLIVEAEPLFGSGNSSRNSEVIHGGLYYAPGSLKARLCVRGRGLLYEFCETRAVPYRRIGKLIFASAPEEVPALERIAARAAAAGASELGWMEGHEARQLEPELHSVAALHSPMTGIVDSHALMTAMLAEIEARGGQLVYRTKVAALRQGRDGWGVWLDGDSEPALSARRIVNAAGLGAQDVAGGVEGLDPAFVPRRVLMRGCYFGYGGRVPFSRLIYPVPVPGGLGTHLTFDLGGQARFGPNVQPVDRIDYTVDPGLRDEFGAAARRIWAGIDPDLLYPAYAGIRPKIPAPAGVEPDFVISGPETHGLPNLVLLFGIESPGLTASLAIGEEVAARLQGDVAEEPGAAMEIEA
jgi:L-2-hydroxyglutarate oxidase LhgO